MTLPKRPRSWCCETCANRKPSEFIPGESICLAHIIIAHIITLNEDYLFCLNRCASYSPKEGGGV